jgi:hypothetical protein
MEITTEHKEKFGLYDSIEEVYTFIADNPNRIGWSGRPLDQKGKNSIQWIAHYMPILYEYAQKCNSVIEIGVNQVCSTWAFLHAAPVDGVTSIDIDLQRSAYMKRHDMESNIWLQWAYELAEKETVKFEAIESDSLKIKLPEHDLLFIDSLHTYEQLSQELTLHGNKTQKYLILHDTLIYPELNQAIQEFMDVNKQFEVHEIYKSIPGLTILKNTKNVNE